MKEPKAIFNIEVYDQPNKSSYHKARYLVHAKNDVLWTDSLDDAMTYMKDSIARTVGVDSKEDQDLEDFIMKPAGKIKLKATGVNRYAGGDSKWHTVTGYSIEEHAYADPDDAYGSIFMMFTWEGKENNRGVCVKITEEHSDNLVFKDCNSGKSLTAKQAVDIILGNTKPKQPRENKNGRHNDKKTDRRKVQKVRTVRDRVKRDSKLV